MASRYEILLENYNKTIQVEALTAVKMARNEIYPAAVAYLKTLTKTALEVKEAGVDNAFLVDDVKVLSELLNDMKAKMLVLDEEILKAQSCDGEVMEQAVLWRDGVFVAMNRLREVADAIEAKVDAKYWPMPTYVDLLFGI